MNSKIEKAQVLRKALIEFNEEFSNMTIEEVVVTFEFMAQERKHVHNLMTKTELMTFDQAIETYIDYYKKERPDDKILNKLMKDYDEEMNKIDI